MSSAASAIEASAPRQDPLGGMLLLAASAASFAVMSVLAHAIELHFMVLSFFRGLITVALLLPIALRLRLPLLGRDRKWLLVRSLAGSVALLGYFYALQHIGLGDAALLCYSNPIWIAFLAPVLLGERVSRPRILAIAVGFLGLVLVLGPTGRWLEPGGLAALSSGLASGFAHIAVRRLRGDHPLIVVLHFAVVSALISLPGALLFGRLPTGGVEWGTVLGVGLLAALGQALMTTGYRRVEASAGSIMSLLNPVLAQLFAALLFVEPFGLPQLTGGALVIASGVYLSRAEAVSHLKQKRLPRPLEEEAG